MSLYVREEVFSKKCPDADQYLLKNIYRFERIFGPTSVSTGGEFSTKELCFRLNLKPGQKVLDIGCGVGGSAVHMARQYGCVVYGVDISSDMISIAKNRLKLETETIRDRVTFEVCDILKVNFPAGEFDAIFSKDVILHIKDKESLYSRVLSWLKTGGTLLVTEYVKGEEMDSPEYIKYIKEKGFHLRTLNEYKNGLKKTGFREVEALDLVEMFLRFLEEELKYFIPTKEAFILDFSEKDYDWILKNWHSKINLAKAGDLSWALFICKK